MLPSALSRNRNRLFGHLGREMRPKSSVSTNLRSGTSRFCRPRQRIDYLWTRRHRCYQKLMVSGERPCDRRPIIIVAAVEHSMTHRGRARMLRAVKGGRRCVARSGSIPELPMAWSLDGRLRLGAHV